jgi:hypothetical protein
MQDKRGQPFLVTSDYVTTGFPMAFIILVAVQSVGFLYMDMLGW